MESILLFILSVVVFFGILYLIIKAAVRNGIWEAGLGHRPRPVADERPDSLVLCPGCGKKYMDHYDACPHCGHESPRVPHP